MAEARAEGEQSPGRTAVVPTPAGPDAGVEVPGTPPSAAMPTRVRLLRTAGLVTVIQLLGSAFGLVRDVLLAHLFGAGPATDAFLVAWTIPETASPLLMEGALAYLLVPRLSRALELEGSLQRVLDRALLPALVVLAVLTAVVALAAPLVVQLLAPGLADPELAVRCVRAAAPTILFLGLSGVLMATLRATGSFLLPAWVYVVYNVGILAALLLLHERWGIYSAAVGLTIGSAGMVALQAGPFLRRVRLRSLRLQLARPLFLALVAFLPIGLYTLARQAQVFVERFLGSTLDPGAISHLNYATKVGQIPLGLAIAVAMVSMPTLSRHAAAERTTELRQGIEQTLRLGVLVIAPVDAGLIAMAPEVITVLFGHGEFGTADVRDTAGILRVYSAGLLGQTVVGVLAVCYWARARRTWWPATATGAGLLATVAVGVLAVEPLGTRGLALANAGGITVAAVLLLAGLSSRVVAIRVGQLLGTIALAGGIATAAGLGAWLTAGLLDGVLPALVRAVVAGVVLLAVYGAGAWLSGIPEVRAAASRLATRRSRAA